MLRIYFKIAVKQLLKNKTFSVVNIVGLAIGMASFILIALWIKDEMSYDLFHAKKDRIYQVWNKGSWSGKIECWNVTPKVMAGTLREFYPEIEKVARVDWENSRLVTYKDKKISIMGQAVDPEFLSIFDYKLLEGDTATVFKDPLSIVITPSFAEKVFGKENPIGKAVQLENKEFVKVTGIIQSPPANSKFKFEYLLPWKYLERGEGADKNWDDNSTSNYVLLKPNVSLEGVQQKIEDIRTRFGGVKPENAVTTSFLYPMERWRLYGKFENGVESGGMITLIRLFGIIALFILLIACINFMNLSTARSEKRAREVGLRKTVGAMRSTLIAQFLVESIVLALLAFGIAVLMAELSLPAFNNLFKKAIVLEYGNVWFWILGLGFVLLTGLLAGSYPAFYLSSFDPIRVLKGTYRSVGAVITPRKVLVVFQFSFAIILIICTLVIKQQINHGVERYAGYERSNLAYHFVSNDLEKNYMLLKKELINSGLAQSVTKCSAPLTEQWSNSSGFEWEGKDKNSDILFDRYVADDAIGKTAGFQFVKGRDFELNTYPTDSFGVIINESAVKVMGFQDPIGKVVKDGDEVYHVVGVIKDFILGSPLFKTKPIIILGSGRGWYNVIHIRAGNGGFNLPAVEAVFKKYNPAYPFDLKFVEVEYAKKFERIELLGALALLFAGLTIIISCLGLFGLASYIAENRTKEIGIRKVLGASTVEISTMLSTDFLKLVLIAFVIAAPCAWYFMKEWLNTFEYRINMSWFVFAVAGLLAIVISMVTIIYQSIRAAKANPVVSLRAE